MRLAASLLVSLLRPQEYLGELVRVAEEEQVAVMGYIAWSLLDSFEWSANYGFVWPLRRLDSDGCLAF